MSKTIPKHHNPHEELPPEEKPSKRRTLEERLDEALKDTFPASDPIAVTPDANRKRKKPRKRD